MPVLELVVGGVNDDWREGVDGMRAMADAEAP